MNYNSDHQTHKQIINNIAGKIKEIDPKNLAELNSYLLLLLFSLLKLEFDKSTKNNCKVPSSNKVVHDDDDKNKCEKIDDKTHCECDPPFPHKSICTHHKNCHHPHHHNFLAKKEKNWSCRDSCCVYCYCSCEKDRTDAWLEHIRKLSKWKENEHKHCCCQKHCDGEHPDKKLFSKEEMESEFHKGHCKCKHKLDEKNESSSSSHEFEDHCDYSSNKVKYFYGHIPLKSIRKSRWPFMKNRRHRSNKRHP